MEDKSLGHCRYCNEEIFGTHINKLTAHQKICKCNPKYESNIQILRQNGKKTSQKLSNIKHQLFLKDEMTKTTRTFVCEKCGNDYQLTLTDSQYFKMIQNKDKHYFCSKACANSRKHKQEIRDMISKSLLEYWKHNKKPSICRNCNNEFDFQVSHLKYYCSTECKKKYEYRRKDELKCIRQNAGKKAASHNALLRRSKNEMMFCELCEKHFIRVEHNKPIFNGWDSDVLIYDYKIAVLWNGKWHYEIVMKNQYSSLSQIQNRDKIKIKEILKSGWTPYIIKDMGRYNPKFVNEQFEKFILTCQNRYGTLS